MQVTVQELLAAAQADSERKTKPGAGRFDTLFKVGNRVLVLAKEPLSTPPPISASCGRAGMAPSP